LNKRKTNIEFIKDAIKIHRNKYDYSLVNYINNRTNVIIICPIHGKFLQTPTSHLENHGCPSCSNVKKLNTSEFIKRAKIIHGGKYNYSLTNYVNIRTKVEIICHIHGKFSQIPSKHLSGNGCSKCSGKFLNTDLFITKAKKIHRNKYDYSLVKYKLNKQNIKIICPLHGIFKQTPNTHLKGSGCPICSENFLNTDLFKIKAKKIHGNKYDYSLVKYKLSNKKIKIVCSIHGIFEQTPNSHLRGKGCPKCTGKTTDKFIKEAKHIHGNKYDYSKVNYTGSQNKVKIVCKKHGIFEQTPKNHLSGSNCPKCKGSSGEIYILNFLDNNNIKNIIQYRFKECINKLPLPFDFYLNNYNTCIEFQGEQHFRPIDFYGGIKKFKQFKKNDRIKEKYCKENKITLIIIFKKNWNSKKYYFVDFYNNIHKNISKILQNTKIIQYSVDEYINFKNSFIT